MDTLAIQELIVEFVQNQTLLFIKKGVDKVKEEVMQLANNRIKEYLQTEFARNSKAKTLLHRNEPVELNSFYQPLYLRKTYNSWDMATNRKTSINKINTEKVESLFEKNNCITIIGSAGSGKSTLVKYLFTNSISQNVKIPIKIELRNLNSYTLDLQSYIRDEIIKFSGISEKDNIINRLMENGAFLIFFDGYDEVLSEKKSSVASSIVRMSTKYNKNYYVLTSRPFVNIEMLENFTNYSICELDKDERISFVYRQFDNSEQEIAERIVETIQSNGMRSYDTFLSNPLLLSMFIITYRTDSNIPQKKSDYYAQVFNALYSLHDTSSKLGFIRERRSGLSKEEFEDVLKKFSLYTFVKQQYIFSHQDISVAMKEIKEKYNKKYEIEHLLDDLVVSIGVLSEEGLDYTFPHRSMQEYFAALYISSLQGANKISMYNIFINKAITEAYSFNNIEDYTNFISLLHEIEPINFKKLFSIPALRLTQEKSQQMSAHDSSIHFFITIMRYAPYIDIEIENDFYAKHHECSLFFNNYMKEHKTEQKKKKARIDSLAEEARRIISSEYIEPFMKKYDYQGIIDKINQEIDKEDDTDKLFIESML